MGNWLSAMFRRSRRPKVAAYASLLRRYDAYLKLLRANNEFLELLAEMEDMGTSAGLCGWERLRNTVTRLNVQVFGMARMLGDLSGGRYDELFPAIEGLGNAMQSLVDRDPGERRSGPPVVILGGAGSDAEWLVGGKAARLCALGRAPGVIVPRGFVLTTSAFREFLRHNGLEDLVRTLWDTLDPAEPPHLIEISQTLREAVLHGALPAAVEGPLLAGVEELVGRLPPGARFAVRSSASGEDSTFSFAGQYDSLLRVPPYEVVPAVIQVFAGFFNPGAVMLRLKRGFGALELGMGALVMAMVEGRVSGVAYSRQPSAAGTDSVRVEALPGLGSKLVDGAVTPVSYEVSRTGAPFSIGAEASDAAGPSLLSAEEGGLVAALALIAEGQLETAADVEWTVDWDGQLWLIQARPMALRPTSRRAGAPVRGYRVLLKDGVTASAGAAAGPVAHVRDVRDASTFPDRFVAVAGEATPDLALLLPRACALVTERGGMASHMAAVAREFGVPAVFGLEGAMDALAPGEVVTVDAAAGLVYRGVVPPVLEAESPETTLPPTPGPVRDVVAGLLPMVVPLNLLDPRSPSFAPSGCRSLHDVVRFIHEKALAEMMNLPEFVDGGTEKAGLLVTARLPFELRLLPLGSGIEGAGEGAQVSLGQVTSVPARALLSGMADPGLRREGPRPLDTSGFLAVVSGSLAGDAGLGEPAWALISDRYLLLSVRLAYHFATVEAFAGPRSEENRIRFLFKGGAADEVRRQRRARFLAGVLEAMGFQVRRKGDLVSALFGRGTQSETAAKLEQLGRLLSCAGQLDMVMASDRHVGWYVEGFLKGDYPRILRAEALPVQGG